MIKRVEIFRNLKEELLYLEEEFQGKSRRLFKRIDQDKPFDLNAYKNVGLDLAILRSIVKADKNLKKCFFWFVEFGVNHFKREYSIRRFKTIIEGKEVEIENSSDRYGTSIFDWWQLFNIALILRNDELKNDLYALLPRCMEVSKDPFWRRSMDLILMCMGHKEFEVSVLDDLKNIVDSGYVEFHGLSGKGVVKSEEGKEIREMMWLPIMELYYLAHQKEEVGFNDLLSEFLKSKKEWIIRNGEADNSGYWIDFPLLACCAYAYDNGVSISVKSDYIPAYIYRGDLE